MYTEISNTKMSDDDSSLSSNDSREMWPDDSDITEAWSIAEKRGGECLSKSEDEYLWSCKKGHQWRSSLDSVKNKYTWCPICPYTPERTCRFIFEDLLDKKFPPHSPPFLNGLKLDGYNEVLKLAFEYNGRQHYEIASVFHPHGQVDLDNQIKRDREKLNLCIKNKIRLIVVPYDVEPLEFIRKSLTKLGLLFQDKTPSGGNSSKLTSIGINSSRTNARLGPFSK